MTIKSIIIALTVAFAFTGTAQASNPAWVSQTYSSRTGEFMYGFYFDKWSNNQNIACRYANGISNSRCIQATGPPPNGWRLVVNGRFDSVAYGFNAKENCETGARTAGVPAHCQPHTN